MPHYRDGTPVRVGDVVRGRGYNVPHEVVGLVLGVAANRSCNVKLACVTKTSRALGEDTVLATVEYGQADQFEKIA